MNKYVIGIIDEDNEDIDYIKRTIFINKPENVGDAQVDFVEYTLDATSDSLTDIIVNSAIEDIVDANIQALIVDYKIIVSSTLLEGTEIFKRITDIVSKFPIIILSNVPSDCYSKEFVDADKVYSKTNFFKVEEDYSKEKTLNIFRNMDNYVSQRAKLSTKLTDQLSNLTNGEYSEENLKAIVETETLLDAFFPQNQSSVEKALDVSDLKGAVDLLEQVKGLLGGENED